MARKTRKGRAVKVPVQVEQVARVEEQVVEVDSDVSTVPQGTVEAQPTAAQVEQEIKVEAQPTKQAKVKEPKAPAPPKAPKKPMGGGALVKLLLFAEPGLNTDAIMEKLGKASPSRQTVSLVRFETLQCLRLLRQEGLLREGFPEIP